ncbi:MAG: PAS domain S-box protein [Candidatus Margulisbacteria bacterium]|nr:PAS domain S-box protein [Candidatus Margulisiibacteriota bacterium]
MTIELLRFLILAFGWPSLISGSLYFLFSSYRFNRNVHGAIFGKLVLIMTFGWLLTMYCLGIVATLAMFLDVRIGVQYVFPVFVVWAASMLMIYASIRRWTKEAATINEFYQDIERKYQSIFEVSPEAILLTDTNGIVLSANDRLQEWLGYKTEEIIGKNLIILPFLTEESKAIIMKNFSRRLQGKAAPAYEITFFNSKNQVMCGRVVDTIMKDEKGAPVRSLTMISDVTERMQLEKLREDLTHMIIHDLKNPLTGIQGAVDLLLKERVGPINEEQKKLAGIAASSTKKLFNLIMDLLDIKKIEENQLVLSRTTFSARELANNLAWVVSYGQQQGKVVILNKLIDINITADLNLLTRVLENLLSNALKHTPDGGTIELRIREEKDHLVFEVADNGEGIPRECLARVFDKFFKVEDQKMKTKIDTGLGLTFCKLAVEAHGGKIGVESTVGQGSRFYFTLPASSTTSPASTASSSAPAAA